MSEWKLHEAKDKFSSVVKAAASGDPQMVTKRGKPAVAVIAIDDYEELEHLRKATSASLPDLLLDMPQGSGELNRLDLHARRMGA